MTAPRDPEDLEPESASEEEAQAQRSRTSLKNERVNNETALAKLSEELLPLSEQQLVRLGAPEDVLDAVLAAKKIKSFTAKNRQLRVIRARLRATDWTQIRRALDHIRAGFSIESAPTAPSGLADRWCEQLLIQGDAGLVRFCEEFEHADRGRLRQLVRNVQRAPDLKRGKARLQLERAVLDVVGDQP